MNERAGVASDPLPSIAFALLTQKAGVPAYVQGLNALRTWREAAVAACCSLEPAMRLKVLQPHLKHTTPIEEISSLSSHETIAISARMRNWRY